MNEKEICQNNHSGFERLRYYFGKMMTVRDFTDQQNYFNEKRWLLNRAGLGWGVLYGLKVKPHATNNAIVLVEPGLALDKNGNEIMVCQEQGLNLEKVVGAPPVSSPPEPVCFYVYLQYKECLAEPSPVPVEDCEGLASECEHNRIRETFKLEISYAPPPDPDLSNLFNLLDENFQTELNCVIDCLRFLKNPRPVITDHLPKQEKCYAIPLAKIWYSESSPPGNLMIDNNFRKVVYSNEILFELIHCLEHELWKVHAAHYDRRRHVPLLAQSIRGLHYRDGKLISKSPKDLKYPTRILSDGHYLWITDQETQKVFRINPCDFQEVTEESNLPDMKGWGLAFDGDYMWISQPEADKISGFNICNPADTPRKIELYSVGDDPREILFDNTYLWISHKNDAGKPTLSVVDCVESKILATLPIPFSVTDATGKTRTDGVISSEIKAMTCDGCTVWVIFEERSGNGLMNFTYEDGEIKCVGEAIDCQGGTPEDITFDGSHIWVSHNKGVSKIDIHKREFVWTAHNNQKLTAIAFDGNFIWAADRNDKMLYRVDLFSEPYDGYEDISDAPDEADYLISRMCFDGSFLWIIASYNNNSTGIIHRLLV